MGFLVSRNQSTQDWDQVVGGIDKDGFYCSLANFLKATQQITLLRHTVEPVRYDYIPILRTPGKTWAIHIENDLTVMVPYLLNNAMLSTVLH
jgi:hypothetical protein